MSESKKATVTVDLSPFKKRTVACDATVHFGTLSQPEELSIVVGGLNADDFNKLMQGQIEIGTIFGSPKVTGTVEGVEFETELGFVKGIDFGSDYILVRCFIGPSAETHAIPKEGCRFWKFRLANLRLSCGDAFTHQPPPIETVPPEKIDEYHALIAEWHKAFGKPPLTMQQIKEKYTNFTDKGGLRRNRIAFNFAGRTWLLDDDLHGRWEKNLNKIATPVVSGTLSTEIVEGDVEENVRELATDICDLLTFALARDVEWIAFGCFTDEGKSHKVFQRLPGLLPFNQHGSPTIDNWEGGNLKGFMEVASARLHEDREWWSVSIGLLMQARGSKYLEVKCSLLNTLLDRLTTRILGEATEPEIDAALPAKLDDKDFRTTLHFILASLAPKWERSRTGDLIGKIKEWNKSPSFPKKIVRSCEKLKIPPMSGKKLGFRHVLIHDGEMHSDLKSPDERFQYFCELEALVLLLMCRMFGFEGHIFLQVAPPDSKPVSEFLAVQEVGA
ncbi:MAG: hypothetical protein U0795_23420 [Pirellulales bacterium]